MSAYLHHIDLTVSDLDRSTKFYDQILPLIGLHRIADSIDGGPLWAAARFELGLAPARPGSKERPHDRYSPGLHHLAFGAPNRAAVDHLHEQLLRLGIEILDAPAEYPQYTPGYYAVFFADPDGMKLEYVFTPERHG